MSNTKMTRFALILLIIIQAMSSGAQVVYPYVGVPKGTSRFAGAVLVDSMFILPVKSNATWGYPSPAIRKNGETYISNADSLPYFYNGLISRRPTFFADTNYNNGFIGTQYQNKLTFQYGGNTFPFSGNVFLGTNDNRSMFFKVNNSNAGGWTSSDVGSFLVNNIVWDASSAAKLQVNGSIKTLANGYTTGGYRYLVLNSTTSNIERTSTIPLVETRANIRSIADVNVNIATTDYIILFTSLTATRDVILPLASTMINQIVIVKDGTGSADSNPILVKRTSPNLVDGSTIYGISTKYGAKGFLSDGINWYSIY